MTDTANWTISLPSEVNRVLFLGDEIIATAFYDSAAALRLKDGTSCMTLGDTTLTCAVLGALLHNFPSLNKALYGLAVQETLTQGKPVITPAKNDEL